jgi:hypothetical protein
MQTTLPWDTVQHAGPICIFQVFLSSSQICKLVLIVSGARLNLYQTQVYDLKSSTTSTSSLRLKENRLGHTGVGQNNVNTKKLRNRIHFGYIERTSVGNTECSFICKHSVVLVSMH